MANSTKRGSFNDRVGAFVELVAKCTTTFAEIDLRYVSGPGLNVVSDGRKLHRGQTLLSGDLSLGGGIASSTLDRVNFDIANPGNGATLNGHHRAWWKVGRRER